MPHHSERFGTALSVLAGHGHIKSRLTRAFDENLNEIDDSTLPRAVRRSFSELRRRLTSVAPLNGEGRVCASVRKMSIQEADECARILVELYAKLLLAGESPRAVDLDKDAAVDEVPAVLLKSV